MTGFRPDPNDGGKGRGAPPGRGCDSPGCDADGVHRAPRSRDSLREYYWFCLEHIRGYNAAWNFFAGMKQGEIEAYLHADFTWHRPTWPLGGQARLNGMWNGSAFEDPFGAFGARAENEGGAANGAHWRPPAGEREALAIMNLPLTATADEIKSRYKALVKRLHPDVNGDDKQAVDQLKVVIEAYRVLSRRPRA